MSEGITERLRRRPSPFLFALSVTLFMSAARYSAPIVAVQGAVLAIWTTWYIATDTDQ